MLPWEIKAKFISLHLFSKIILTLPFLSKWSFLGTMEVTRTVLFSCWLDLANDKILSATDCGVILQIISSAVNYDTFGLAFIVGLIYNYISSFFAPGKNLTTNKSSLVVTPNL